VSNLLNIMAVSLESDKRHKAYAVYDGKRLAVTHCISIVGAISTWEGALIEEIESKHQLGNFTVLVEDRSEQFCVGDAIPFSFDEIIDGRSVLYHALDQYFSLLYMGNLITDSSVERFLFRPGSEGAKVEKKQDEKGRTIYSVDWTSFSGGQKAILMCVCAATFRSLTEVFIDQMFSVRPDEQPADRLRSWDAITKGYTKQLIAQWSDYYEDGH
jgi:hypothetical protein